MSMVVEDLELEEVDLNETALTPRVPDPVNSNLETDKEVSLDREEYKDQQNGDNPTQDSNISRKDSSKGELGESQGETTKKSLKRRVLESVRRVAQELKQLLNERTKRYEKNAEKTIINTLGMAFLKDKAETMDDDSFDGHLFEYAMHVQNEPQVKVPRLHLKPTLKERAVGLMRRIFLGCARNKQSYGYESSSDRF